MSIYPVEFHRRLERKWARRIDHIPTVTGNATPPRDPNDDDDYEDEEDEEQPDLGKLRHTRARRRVPCPSG